MSLLIYTTVNYQAYVYIRKNITTICNSTLILGFKLHRNINIFQVRERFQFEQNKMI